VALQQDRVFDPTYAPRRYALVALALVPGAGVFAFVMASHLSGPALSLAGLLLVVPPLAFWTRLVRRVVFGEHLVVFRHLLIDRYLKYTELHRIREDGLETARGFVGATEWTNRKAFYELLADLHAEGRFGKTRVDPGVLPPRGP
jgi:hypothetical protein